jgi:hypothetical protein
VVPSSAISSERPASARGSHAASATRKSSTSTPAYDRDNAAYFASLGVPAFACSPDQFPDLIAAAIERRDIATWAAKVDITTARAG